MLTISCIILFRISCNSSALCSKFYAFYAIHRTGQDSRWQQSGTSHILISATHWPHRPCIAPWWFDRVSNKPSVKADLAIYSYVLGTFKSVGLIISNKLDFISCADKDGFCKSSHIYVASFKRIFASLFYAPTS